MLFSSPAIRHLAFGGALVASISLTPLSFTAARAQGAVDRYAEYTLGVFKMASGDYLAAADHLEYAWRSTGHAVGAGMALARCYYALKNFTRAEMVVDDVLDSGEDNREAWMLKARMRYLQRDRRAAALCLERAREVGGASLEVERLLGNVYYELGDADPAIEAYRRCLAVDSGLPFIQLRYGRLLASIGRWEEAEAAFRAAWSIDEDFTEPASELARLLMDTDRPAAAIDVLERLVARKPGDDESLMTLVGLLHGAGRSEEAIAALEDRRDARPLTRDARLTLGKLYFDAGRYEPARAEFAKLFAGESRSPELARILAEVHLHLGDAASAREYYERAIALAPGDYHGYIGLYFASTPRFTSAPVRVTLGEGEAARLIATAAERVSRDDFDGNYMLGVAWMSVDSVRAASVYLRRASALKPRDRSTLLNLASAWEKLGRFEKALPLVEVLYKAAPDDATILNFYAYLLAETGTELQRAARLVERALAGDPDNGYYLDTLGWIYYQMGDFPKAVVTLNRASEHSADDPVILEHLGDAYRAMRRFSEARAAYERSNRLQGGSDSILEKIESTERPR